MSVDPHALITARPPDRVGYGEPDGDLCMREMDAHVAKAIALVVGGWQDPMDVARGQAHATLALAWATRLGATS